MTPKKRIATRTRNLQMMRYVLLAMATVGSVALAAQENAFIYKFEK